MSDTSHLAKRAHRARGNANAAAVDTDDLEIHVLLAAGRDVGVAARVADIGFLAGENIDAGHMIGPDLSP